MFLVAVGLACGILLLSWFLLARPNQKEPVAEGILAVMGSGGHTNEMIRLIEGLDPDLRPTHFVLGHDDKLSQLKLEQSLKLKSKAYFIISRPRAVGQSYLTSVVTSLKTMMNCCSVFNSFMPRLIYCNGPGLCVIIATSSYLVALMTSVRRPKIVYVESFARVDKLSLSGRIMERLSDAFYVQWPRLSSKHRRYIGPLV